MESKTRVVKEPLEIGKVLSNALNMAVKYAPVLLILAIFSNIIEIVFPGINRVVYQNFLKNYGMAGKLASLTVKALITTITWLIGSAIAYTFAHKTEIEKQEYTPALLHSLGIIFSKRFLSYVSNIIMYYLTVLFGAVLFIVPGIVWSLKYKFAAMIALLGPEGADASSPFKESARITDKYKVDLFLVSFFIGSVNLIGRLAQDSGMQSQFPLAGLINVLVMSVTVTVNILLMYILLDKKKVNIETSETGTQTYIVKAGSDGEKHTGIIVLIIFVFLGIKVGIYYVNPHGSIELSDHISLRTNAGWRVEEDKFIPGDYVLTIPNLKAGRQLVVRNASKKSLNIQDAEINDAVRAVLDPYTLELERTADMGFTAADTPSQRGEIDVNGKKWAVCEYRNQGKERTRVLKVYYTLMGESIPQVSYMYLYMTKANALRAEEAAKKDEETVKAILGRISEKIDKKQG